MEPRKYSLPRRNRKNRTETLEQVAVALAGLGLAIVAAWAIWTGVWVTALGSFLGLVATWAITKAREKAWAKKRRQAGFIELAELRRAFPMAGIGVDVQRDRLAVVLDPTLYPCEVDPIETHPHYPAMVERYGEQPWNVAQIFPPRAEQDGVLLDPEDRFWGDVTSGSRPGLGRKFTSPEIRRRVAWLRKNSSLAQAILKEYLDDVETDLETNDTPKK